MAFGRPVRPLCRSLVLLTALVVRPATGRAQAPAQSAPPAPAPTFKVEVIETTPLPGLNLKLEQIPAPVQAAVSADVEASGALDLSDFLNRRFTGVFINEMSGNPFQADLNYRGYTASPRARHAAGLVDLHGRRAAQSAVWRRRELGSHSPPGDRVDDADAGLESSVRSQHARRRAVDSDEGWPQLSRHDDARDLTAATCGAPWSSSTAAAGPAACIGIWPAICSRTTAGATRRRREVGQLFGKVGRHDAKHDTALSVGYADNALNGSALQEQRLLARDYASVYTKPDETDNRSTFVNLTTRNDRSRRLTLSGNVYYRDIRTNTFNGDINDDSLDQAVYQPSAAEQRALAAAGYTGFPTSGATAANTPFPVWRCIGNVLLNDEPGEKCNALLNRADSVQRNVGLSGQVTWRDWLAPRNTLTVGAGYDHSRSAFHAVDGAWVPQSRSQCDRTERLRRRRSPAETSTGSHSTTAWTSKAAFTPAACSRPTCWRSATRGT